MNNKNKQPNVKFSKKNERDMFGTPINRAKTWGKKSNDPKKDRLEWKTKIGN
jgi:hypothetical protein|tara:strand:- start:699 stop:854 length:156 start_codon:yes stop_codon:yes gene_type:complete